MQDDDEVLWNLTSQIHITFQLYRFSNDFFHLEYCFILTIVQISDPEKNVYFHSSLTL